MEVRSTFTSSLKIVCNWKMMENQLTQKMKKKNWEGWINSIWSKLDIFLPVIYLHISSLPKEQLWVHATTAQFGRRLVQKIIILILVYIFTICPRSKDLKNVFIVAHDANLTPAQSYKCNILKLLNIECHLMRGEEK